MKISFYNVENMLLDEDPSSYEEFNTWDDNIDSINFSALEIDYLVELIIKTHPNHSGFLYLVLDAISNSNLFPNEVPSIWKLFLLNNSHNAIDNLFDSIYFQGGKPLLTKVFPSGLSPLDLPNNYILQAKMYETPNYLDIKIADYLMTNNSFLEGKKETVTKINLKKLSIILGE